MDSRRIVSLLLLLGVIGLAVPSHAVITFDGSNYADVNAAITAAITASDNVVEIATNGPLAGDVALYNPAIGSVGGSFTLRAATGFTPVINGAVLISRTPTTTTTFVRSDLSSMVTLQGMTIAATPTANHGAVTCLGNVLIKDCTITGTGSQGNGIMGGYHNTGLASPVAGYTLTVEGSTITGALDGICIQKYTHLIVRDSTVNTTYGTVSNYQYACVFVAQSQTWQQSERDNRTVTLERSKFFMKGNQGWHIVYPFSTTHHRATYDCGSASVGAEPVLTATNCLFVNEGLTVARTSSQWSWLGVKNRMTATFNHCTWRMEKAPTLFALHVTQPTQAAVYISDYLAGTAGENIDQTYSFTNCLFDLVQQTHSKFYAVLVDNPTSDTTTGSDANVYLMDTTNPHLSGEATGGKGYVTGPPPTTVSSNLQQRLVPFEATQHAYVSSDSYIEQRNITLASGLVNTTTPTLAQHVAEKAVASAVDKDIEGEARPQGLAADVGCDEEAFNSTVTFSSGALSFTEGTGFEVDVELGGEPTTRTLQISAVGLFPFNVTSLGISGINQDDWSLVNPPTLPAQVSPGAPLDVTIQFNPTQSSRTMDLVAQVDIGTDAFDQATLKVDLFGDAVPVELSSFSIE